MTLSYEEKKEIAELIGSALGKVFEETLSVVDNEISQTKVSPAVGMMGVGHFNDLLHGGAYTVPVEELPYYTPKVQEQIKFTQTPTNTIILGNIGIYYKIEMPDGSVIALPGGAKPEQVEAIVNSKAPRRFPKILSDQQYYLNKEWVSLFFDEQLAAGIVSNISTLVEAGRGIEEAAFKGLAGLISAKKPSAPTKK